MPRAAVLIVIAYVAAGLSLPACAQTDWPGRPVILIVPFPPGGGTDAFARPLAAQLLKQTGRSFVIQNNAGAGGNVGATVASRAAPDGYTFFMGAVHHAIAPSVYTRLDYDLERDFSPVTSIAHMPQVIEVNPDRLRVFSLKELIATLQSQPGRYSFGSGGNGTSHHVSGEMFKILTKTDILHIPYKGNGPAMAALIGGEIHMMVDALGASAGAIRGGKVRALAVASKQRAPGFGEIPTTAEAGLPEFVIGTWYAVWARKGTPQAIIDRMHGEIVRALDSQSLKDVWISQGATPGGEPPQQFGAFVQNEIERWGKVARAAGARAD
ncbi:MAG: tripartite tricarboxylate transporter substrate binding protein [Burkholderiales bacterium]|nr:tripartite tricarboxylate transporter substrate binding protein [Burkholderiales bacterium]